MKSRINRSLLFITAYLLIFSTGDTLFSWHFFLKKNTTLSEPTVKVGDVGNIYGTDLNQKQKIDLQNTVIAERPLLDANWNVEFIRSLLDKKFLYPESVRGAEVQVSIPSREYSVEEIAEAIRGAYPGSLSNDFKVVVKNSIRLPEKPEFKVKVDTKKLPGEKIAGFVFNTGFLNNSSEKSIKVSSVKISYTLLKNFTMIIATADMESGDRLTSHNIKKTDMWLDHPVDQVFTEIPVGYIATRKIDKDGLIMPSDAIKKVDVNYGDHLTIEYKGLNLVIQSTVSAAEAGSIGQVIKFRTRQNKIIYGEIVTANLANFSDKRK
jgi:flagella basal body P-ring formation protein FlgA